MSVITPGVLTLVRGRRLSRILKIIALLRGPSSFNARRLADQFSTSRRNIYRDIAILELAGVPVYHDPDFGDTGGGYRIRSDWWFPHVGLTDRECLDLAVLTRVAESKSIPLLDEVCSARDKLLGTLPGKQQDLIHAAAELFDIIGLNLADHSHCRHVMTTLQTALLAQMQVEATYRSPHEGKVVRLSLQPRRIFLANQAWYLAGWDNKTKTDRLYRVARFKDMKVTTKPMDVSRSFSLREMLGNAWTVYRGDRDYHIEIEFSPEAAELVAETRWHPTQELERQKNGSTIFRATVSGLEEIKYWVLSWGARARVIKPKELVREIHDLSAAIIAKYR